ncbi:MAG: DUF1016 N-terminal domain-containing protein [Coriobacteriia bacterium]|nr:DUF1016 N-terminal domain-containing protein [Coriobacteriia bacterium]
MTSAGWSKPNLLRMVQFADYFPDDGIVPPVAAQLSWSHFAEVIIMTIPMTVATSARSRRLRRQQAPS